MKNALIVLALIFSTSVNAQTRLTNSDIVEAYEYMLGRWLVLRQENLDLKGGFKWNQIVHREPDGSDAVNPDFDVVNSEAWIAIDEGSCTLIELPEIKGRYYTVEALNGWGEVTANINERTYTKHPFGKFALCLKETKVTLPKGTQRVNLPNKKSHLVIRIELGAHPDAAIAIQKKIAMKATGAPQIDEAVVKPDFANDKLPGIEGFDKTDRILASERDINVGMIAVQEQARAVAKTGTDRVQRARIDEVIRKQAIPAFLAEIPKMGKAANGWMRPRIVGNYRSDYVLRTIINYTDIWANNSKESVSLVAQGLDGGQSYVLTFPKTTLPASKTRYLWSITVADGRDYKVIPNPSNRYTLNKQSALKYNDDGSLTLAFAPKEPDDVPESNWLPTPNGRKYNVTYRIYGPTKDVVDGSYYPPPLVRISETQTERFIRSLKNATKKK